MNEELIEIVIDDVENEQEVIEIDAQNDIEIDVSESIGWVNVDSTSHYSLYGRDDDDQHPITAISGLRRELDQIKALQVVSADKIGIANYYEWHDGAYDETGYFVSIEPGTSTVKICDGANVFGVTVASAGFVGGQDGVTLDYVNGATNTHGAPRDNSYCLVATSGVVDVRCELDVTVGNCVIPNAQGWAKKSGSNYGYKVLARENKGGVEYAVISLGVQADVTDALGVDLLRINDAVNTNEKNIVSAINVANQAYQKSTESTTVSEDALAKASEAMRKSDGAVNDVKDMNDVLESTSVVAEQAKAIANGAAIHAESMRSEAVRKVNEAWAEIDKLTDNIEIANDKTDKAMSAIIRNARALRSLMTVIDKYSVGEYSQVNGLTLEQAQSILEPGMIYVPTSHGALSAGTKQHTEAYDYTSSPEKWVAENDDRDPGKVYYDNNAKVYWYYNDDWISSDVMPKYTRTFTPGYLYQWGELDNGLYGWITVDKDYNPLIDKDEPDGDEQEKVNASSMAVYFSTIEVVVGDNNNYGYWFTNGDEIIDKDGDSDTYEPYTLYKWEKPEGEDGHWFVVATLAGNVSNRATSQVLQTANEIANEITNAYGSVAGFGAKLTDTESTVSSLAAWKNGDGDVGEAIIRQDAKDGEASIVISTLQRNSKNEVEATASLVLNATKKEGSTKTFLTIGADNINLNGVVTANNNVTIGTDGKITARSGYIGDGENGFEIGSKSIYNKHAIIIPGAGSLSAYLTSPTQINLSSLYCMTDETSEFVYIGTDGIGTVKYTNLDNGNNADAVELSSYMADGKLVSNSIVAKGGWIGSEDSGFEISGNAIRNVINFYGYKSYIGSKGVYIGPSVVPKGDYNYVYVGTDGVSTASVGTLFDGSIYDVSRTYMSDGKLFSNNAEISGKITASSGYIGNLSIVDHGLIARDDNNADVWRLNDDGLYISSDTASITVGNMKVRNIDAGDKMKTRMEISGDFSIDTRDEEGKLVAGISFSSDGGYATKEIPVQILCKADYKQQSGTNVEAVFTVKARTHDDVAAVHDLLADFRFKVFRIDENGKEDVLDIGSLVAIIPAGETSGEKEVITLSGVGADTYLFAIKQFGDGEWTQGYSYNLLKDGDYHSIIDHYHTYTQKILKDTITISGHLVPSNVVYNLGTQNKYWKTIYSYDGSVHASDRNKKNTISLLTDTHTQIFDALQPVSYKFNVNDSNRTHIGFIAQDVKQAVESAGLTTQDFAGYCEWVQDDGTISCGLRYGEFVAMNTYEIQKLKARVAELENEIAVLTNGG